jgi:hypothetical protein
VVVVEEPAVPITPEPASDRPVPTDRWVSVGSYPTRALAQVAASILEGDGYQVRVFGDDAGGVLPHLDTTQGGVHVQVPAPDAEPAAGLLAGLEEPPTVSASSLRPWWRSVLMLLVAAAVLLAVASAFLTRPSLLDL